MLPFIPLKVWQVEYLAHLYPDMFAESTTWSGVRGDYRRLIYETDWDSPEALAFEKVWRVEK